MALIRRSGARFSANIWPGFVDAMTAILLVLMFVLSIFMIVQSILRDTISGQNSELQTLNFQLDEIRSDLEVEKSKLADLDTQYEEKLMALTVLEGKLSVQELRNTNLGEILKEKNFKLNKAQTSLGNLNREVSLLRAQLEDKSKEVVTLSDKNFGLKSKFDAVTATAQERMALLSALREKYAASETKVEQAEQKITDLIAKSLLLTQSKKASENQLKTQIENSRLLALALKNARSEADKNLETARLAAAKTEAFQILVESLKAEKVVLENENLKTNSALEKEQAKALENEKGRLLEQAALAALREKLAAESEELGLLTLNLEAEKQKALKTLELLASARAVKKSLQEKNRLITEKGMSVQAELEAKKLALREARAQLIQEKELIKASASEVNRLNIVSTNLSKKLSELQSILDESESRDAKKSVQIQVLGGRLNAALARVASEQKKIAEIEAREVERLRLEANDLKNYKSEFFGRLKKILGGKPGIEVVGDRFVFSSEVLFKPGSAVLGNDGKVQLTEVARVIRNVSKDIPTQINWVLRVDGHTDIMPLAKTSKYTDNWELSQARALSVVKYLIKVEGLSANRLAATGFGEFQPLTLDLAPESLARNRRIELKLTEK